MITIIDNYEFSVAGLRRTLIYRAGQWYENDMLLYSSGPSLYDSFLGKLRDYLRDIYYRVKMICRGLPAEIGRHIFHIGFTFTPRVVTCRPGS